MVAAVIRIGWRKDCFVGANPNGIMREVENIQNFDCLMSMGRDSENEKGQEELDKLESFLNKYYSNALTMQDIEKLD